MRMALPRVRRLQIGQAFGGDGGQDGLEVDDVGHRLAAEDVLKVKVGAPQELGEGGQATHVVPEALRLVLFAHRVERVNYALDRREAEFALHKLFFPAIQREAVDVGVEVRHVAPPHLLDLAVDYRSFYGYVAFAQEPLERLQAALPFCGAYHGRMVV